MVALTTVTFSSQPDGVKEAGFSGQQYKAECGSRASITELWVSSSIVKNRVLKVQIRTPGQEASELKAPVCCGEVKELLPQRSVF